MLDQELTQIDQDISDLREQLMSKRSALVHQHEGDKTLLKQQIRVLAREIEEFEQDRWLIILNKVKTIDISEEDAKLIVTKSIQEIQENIENQSDRESIEIVKVKKEALANLNKSNKSNLGKLKATLSALPPSVSISYETKIDVISIKDALSSITPTLGSWLINITEKLKKKNI